MEEFSTYWKIWSETLGAIHSTKIPTGPTGKIGPPQKVDPFFRNFSGWTEPIHWVLDRNFRTFWLNGSRSLFTHDRSISSLCSHGTFERLGLEICVRLRWFRVNGTAIRTNFRPAGTLWKTKRRLLEQQKRECLAVRFEQHLFRE